MPDRRGSGGVDSDQALRRGDGDLLDGADLVLGHRQHDRLDRGQAQPGGRVDEDQTALPGEAEQRTQGGDGVA
jgi:hypothetical protein